MRLNHIVGIFAVTLACQASASNIDWIDHGQLEVATGTVNAGSFADKISFTLADATALRVTTVATNLSPLLGISGGTISFYEHGASSDTLLGSYDFNGTTGDLTRTFTPTGPGSYFYQISGTATGSAGGLYSLASAPVPEPRSWALVLCAVVTMGALSRRGKSR